MTVTVDARGLACPQPVILTRNAMRSADQVITLVSDADQVDNVRRLAERAGWVTAVTEDEQGLAIHMIKAPAAGHQSEPAVTHENSMGQAGRHVLVLTGDTIGRGDLELGQILVRSLLYTLQEITPRPDTLILMNAGVKLAVEESPVLADLQHLQQEGVDILVCGTCLDYYHIKHRIAAGVISNMYTIAETMLSAAHCTAL